MPMVTGHLARLQTGLDFVNTLDLWPVPHDHLDSPTQALEWLVEHDLMHREARLPESIARELIQGETSRLRICENPQCRWVFKDTSRTGKRKWCSMRSCGNRAKVARHRARRKAVVN